MASDGKEEAISALTPDKEGEGRARGIPRRAEHAELKSLEQDEEVGGRTGIPV